MEISIKIACAVIASVVALVFGFVPYLRDVFRGRTKPHAYTWLIWSITQGTAFIGMWRGGAGWAMLSMALGESINVIIFILSLRYGTRNITRSDTALFFASLFAILVWWQLHNPILAIILVMLIDLIGGYIPSMRKSYEEPWTETVSSWAVFTIANILTVAALTTLNFLTTAYVAMSIFANATLLLICLFRRRVITHGATLSGKMTNKRK